MRQGAEASTAAQQQQQQGQQPMALHRRWHSAGGSSEGGYDEAQEGSEEGGEGDGGGQRRSGWKILGGVPFLPKIVDLLSPKVSTAEEAEAAAAAEASSGDEGHLQPPTSPGGSSLYPTLAAGSGEVQPRADDEDLQVGAACSLLGTRARYSQGHRCRLPGIRRAWSSRPAGVVGVGVEG